VPVAGSSVGAATELPEVREPRVRCFDNPAQPERFDRVLGRVEEFDVVAVRSVERPADRDAVAVDADDLVERVDGFAAQIFDTFRIHDVLNPTSLYRIHLVMDTVGTPAFWNLVRDGGDPIEVSFRPDEPAVIVPELENLPPVMSPGQMASVIDDLEAELPDSTDAQRLIAACRTLQEGWRAQQTIRPGIFGGPCVRNSPRGC